MDSFKHLKKKTQLNPHLLSEQIQSQNLSHNQHIGVVIAADQDQLG